MVVMASVQRMMATAGGLPLLSTTLLPEEVIMDILSRVPVKSLMRFRCVSKAWNSLPFDPTFIKLHLQRSAKNTHVLLTFAEDVNPSGDLRHEICVRLGAAPCFIPRLLENPSSTINHCFRRFNKNQFVFGACNGLVCLFDSCDFRPEFKEYWVRFWNPATKIMSQNSPRFSLHSSDYDIRPFCVSFGFGFNDSCDTYKVVVILLDIKSHESEVRVHCLGDTCWRKILTCPAFPIRQDFDGKFSSGTLNWLALRKLSLDYDWKAVTINQLVVFSYDLKSETYKYLLMPDSLSQVPYVEPYLTVLKGCLCLSHDHNQTHVVVWLMREFGIEKSWTQLLNVSYNHLQIHDNPPSPAVPLFMFEDEDVMFLAEERGSEFVVYNLIDNRVNRDHGFKYYIFGYLSYDYVQSLVLPY